MTQQTASGNIPSLTLGWRLKMSLDYANISVQAMADQLGVSRTTLSRWMGDKGERPKKAYLSQWALATGVPFEWIDAGIVASSTDPDGGGNQVTDEIRLFPPTWATIIDLHPSGTALAPNHDLSRQAGAA